MKKGMHPKLHIPFLVLYLVLYLVIPLVFVIWKQNEIYAAAGSAGIGDWFLGLGNLMYFIIVLVFVISAFPRDNKRAFGLIFSYALGAGILSASQGLQSISLSLLMQSELIFISMMVTVVLFAVPLLYLILFKEKAFDFKKEPSLILGTIMIVFAVLVSPVGASVIFAQHVFGVQQGLMPDMSAWLVAGILVATVVQFTFFHYSSIQDAINESKEMAKQHKKLQRKKT